MQGQKLQFHIQRKVEILPTKCNLCQQFFPETLHFLSKWHHKLSHSYSTCLVQHGCRKNGGKLLLLGRPADRVSGSPSPLSSLSSLSTGQQWAQFNTNSTQTQWHCPQHGPLNTTGKSTLWKLTGFRQTVSMRSFLFSSLPLYTVRLSHSLHLKKVQPLRDSGTKQATSAAFSKSTLPNPPLYNEA